jgi:hypothetical protein
MLPFFPIYIIDLFFTPQTIIRKASIAGNNAFKFCICPKDPARADTSWGYTKKINGNINNHVLSSTENHKHITTNRKTDKTGVDNKYIGVIANNNPHSINLYLSVKSNIDFDRIEKTEFIPFLSLFLLY